MVAVSPSDYELELGGIECALKEHRAAAGRNPTDAHQLAMYAYRLYQHAALTGDLGELETADAAIDRAIPLAQRPDDLHVLKANLALKLHRLAEVRRQLEKVTSAPGCPRITALWADLDFQEGRYAEAARGYQDAIREQRDWDALARLAYLQAKLGNVAGSEQMLVEAQDELTAKEMRSYAWLELQRGVLDLTRGSFEEAAWHYRRAGQAYSGYWLVDEHMAELLAAEGRLSEAIALYEDVVQRAPKPELKQALGELYLMKGDPEGARPWTQEALAEYLESAERGGVHYYHHLADFYSEVEPDGAEAVKWAVMDWKLRRNFATQAALALALYHAGQVEEGVQQIEAAISSGVKDAHLFRQAATIHDAAGHPDQAAEYSSQAIELNPRHETFHVHR